VQAWQEIETITRELNVRWLLLFYNWMLLLIRFDSSMGIQVGDYRSKFVCLD